MRRDLLRLVLDFLHAHVDGSATNHGAAAAKSACALLNLRRIALDNFHILDRNTEFRCRELRECRLVPLTVPG